MKKFLKVDHFIGKEKAQAENEYYLLNYTWFTKRHFVRHKNPQKLEAACLFQLFSLNSTMLVLVFLIQRPPNGLHFSFRVTFAPHRWIKTKTSYSRSATIFFSCVIILIRFATILVINKENMSKILKKIRKIEIEPETLDQSQNGVRICNWHEKLD